MELSRKITRTKAIKIRNALLATSVSLEDKVAADVAELFPRLKEDGSLVKAGTRIYWRGVLKRAAVDLWDTKENNPDNAPTLWEDLPYHNGYRIIPEVITVGTAFSKGEQGWWKDAVYESIFDGANVWNPEQFAAGWKKVE